MKKLALATTSLIFCVLLGELAFYFVPAFAPAPRAYVGEWPTRSSPNGVTDPVIGWRLKPNHEFTTKTSEFNVTYRSGPLGFRIGDRAAVDTGGPRIIVLGDSFAFGHGVRWEESFAGILEKKLSGTAVDNLAISGFGVDQMHQTLHAFGRAKRPSLVIVAFVLDDFGRSQTAFRRDIGMNKPRFVLRGGHLVPERSSDRPNALFRFMESHSRVWAAVAMATRYLGRHYPVGEWWALNDALLRSIGEESAALGADVLFVHLPTKNPVHVPLLARSMNERGAAYLDLAGERFPSDPQLTYPVDGHLNSEGHRFVAGQLLRWIDSHPISPRQ